jgi:hypothetical protein
MFHWGTPACPAHHLQARTNLEKLCTAFHQQLPRLLLACHGGSEWEEWCHQGCTQQQQQQQRLTKKKAEAQGSVNRTYSTTCSAAAVLQNTLTIESRAAQIVKAIHCTAKCALC